MVDLGMSVTGVAQAIGALKKLKSGVTGGNGYIVGVGAEYGAYVEFGTSVMEAQPYLFPAARHVMRTQFDALARRATDLDDLTRRLALAIEAEAKRRAPVDTGNLRGSIETFPAGAAP
ncbi:neck protein [Halorubrum phage Hardycor1]|nr:neck protein [Halorubrum phage Hardycor1]